MSISTILSMAASALPQRLAFPGTTLADLETDARAAGARVRSAGAGTLAHIGPNTPALATALFAAAEAGVPFAPLNYRLPAPVLRALLDRLDDPLVLAGPEHLDPATATGHRTVPADELLAGPRGDADQQRSAPEAAPDAPAVLLFTSGTTAEPKCVVLRHENLLSYVLGTVEFASAGEDECALVCVPPYHIAGIGSALSNLFAGRRTVHLPDFSPAAWLETARRERVTSAMVVPTMLARIVAELDGRSADCPSLGSLAYGGARMPMPVLEAALRAFPGTGFVNAYGLTETSSTIAVLGPDDHRAGLEAGDPAARARLASAGRLVPGLEALIRDEEGAEVAPGAVGELWVRGAQVSGEYRGESAVLDGDGWFPTRDLARIDEAGYLFLEGRSDDVVIRGGENIAPAEVEDALLRSPGVSDSAVIGVPDDEWGQRLVAVVVRTPGSDVSAEELRAHVRRLLRGSRTPDEVVFRDDLPRTSTGKILRRTLVREIADASAPAPA